MNRIKRVFERFSKRSIRKDGDLYTRRSNGLQLFSESYNILKGTYSNIFERKIYDFEFHGGNPFIVDCGANVGLAALFWKQRFPNAELICFEPSERVFQVLVRNLVINGFHDVKCLKLAVYDEEGEHEFTTNEALSGSLNVEKGLPFRYNVKTARLSPYLTKNVSLLKIDIEGAEVRVLKEIRHKLSLVKRIFIEYHSFENRRQELSILLSILEDAGFRYHLDAGYVVKSPFLGFRRSYSQDLQVNIWGINTLLDEN